MKAPKLLALLLVVFLLAGCGVNTNAEVTSATEEAPAATIEPAAPVRTDINLSLGAPPTTLDPYSPASGADLIVTVQIYEPLVYIDEQNQLQMLLADSYEFNADATEITVHLREGVKFSNGDTLKASDVVFSYTRAAASPAWAGNLGSYDSISAVDDKTVVIKLKGPDVSFPSVAMSNIAIMSETYTTATGDKINEKPMGTGPYLLDSFVPAQSYVFKANPDYWGGAPQIQTANMKVITDMSTAIVAFETGEIDYLIVPSAGWATITAGDFNTRELKTDRVMYAVFNGRKAPFDNPLLRQALSYAVDREAMVAIGADGLGSPAYTLANPAVVLGAAAPTTPYTYDPEKAKALLAEAGYADGLDVGTILAIPFMGNDKLAQAMQQNLADIGVTAEVQLGEFSSVIPDMMSGNFDIIVIGNAQGFDFQAYLQMLGTGMPGNASGLGNPEIDSLFAQAAGITDLAARTAIDQQIVDLANSDAWYVPFIYTISPAAWNKDLIVDQAFVYFQVKYMHWE
jgi:peptide/nickel transport system substrate-binding protein